MINSTMRWVFNEFHHLQKRIRHGERAHVLKYTYALVTNFLKTSSNTPGACAIPARYLIIYIASAMQVSNYLYTLA